jgi:hypothetical protein
MKIMNAEEFKKEQDRLNRPYRCKVSLFELHNQIKDEFKSVGINTNDEIGQELADYILKILEDNQINN